MAETKQKTVRTRGAEKRDKYVAFRWTPSEYEKIGARAQARNMTLTDYVVKASLGELKAPALERKVEDLLERVDRLERLADLGGFG